MNATETTARTAAQSDKQAVLSVRNLSVEFNTADGWKTAVEDVSFDVLEGETLGVVGESGSGKSVTSLAVMGLLGRQGGRIKSGSIVLDGDDLVVTPRRRLEDLRGDRISMIFQEPMTSLNPAFTVGNQIAETIRRHRHTTRRDAWRQAVETLESVGIPRSAQRAHAYPHEFSGGMRQRVMIAMAVSCQPRLLIADEPTTALDVTIQAQILDLLRDMRERLGMSMIFITHDLGVVAEVCDRVVVMYAGQLMEQASIRYLFRQPRHPYTRALLGSMPRLDTPRGELGSIHGSAPALDEMPSGCRFHPRCEYATDDCAHQEPTIDVLSGTGREIRCHHHREIESGVEA